MKCLWIPPPGFEGRDGLVAWEPLVTTLSDGGVEVRTDVQADSLADSLLSVGRDFRIFRRRRCSGVPLPMRTLIVMEPSVTAPLTYARLTRRSFGRIYAASPLWAARLGGESFPWPHSVLAPPASTSIGASHNFRATLINGNKRSAIPGSLYGLRRRVIVQAHQRGVALAVVGPGWGDGLSRQVAAAGRAIAKAGASLTVPDLGEATGDLRTRPPHWLGPIEAKQSAFVLAPTTIVIENSADYVSEKIVDAIACGVAPIYVGPSLHQLGLPDDLAITAPPVASDIISVVESLGPREIDDVVQAGTRWLTEAAGAVDRTRVLKELGARILLDWNGSAA